MMISLGFVICVVLLVGIMVHTFQSTEKSVRKIRLIYAIPTFLCFLIDLGIVYFWIFYGSMSNIPIVKEYPQLLFLPAILTLLCFLVYNARKVKERIIISDIASSTIEQVRFQKHSERKAFDISSDSSEEQNNQKLQ